MLLLVGSRTIPALAGQTICTCPQLHLLIDVDDGAIATAVPLLHNETLTRVVLERVAPVGFATAACYGPTIEA